MPAFYIMEQLTIGNVITTSVSLYKKKFKQYLKQSLIAHLWLLVPVYGWGKYLEVAGNISYTSFQELVKNRYPERKFKKNTRSFLWFHYLAVAVVKFIFYFLFNFILSFIFIVFFTLLAGAIALIFQNPGIINDVVAGMIYFIIAVVFYAFFIFTLIYPYSKMFMSDIIIAEGRENSIFHPIVRSFQLTSTFNVKNIILTILTFGITIPLINFSFIVIAFIVSLLAAIAQQTTQAQLNSDTMGTTYFILWSLFLNFSTLPLWQSIKATVYYQAICDREAFDLEFESLF